MQRKSEEIRLCKVCSAIVKRRRDYHPKVCEACQKFFRRYCRRNSDLPCSGGSRNCTVKVPTRHCCLRCRMDKCLQAGLKSRSLIIDGKPSIQSNSRSFEATPTANISEALENNEVITTSSPSRLLLVRDPILYDGAAIEQSVRAVVASYAAIRIMELVPLTRSSSQLDTPCSSGRERDPIATFLAKGYQHVYCSFAVAASYGKQLSGHAGLTNDELFTLMCPFASTAMVLSQAMPGNTTYKWFFGIEHEMRPAFVTLFPSTQQLIDLQDQLSECLHLWQPTQLEIALLFALLFFDEKSLAIPKSARVRRRLWQSLSIHFASTAGAIDHRRLCFERCLQMINEIHELSRSWFVNVFLAAEPSFAALVLPQTVKKFL